MHADDIDITSPCPLDLRERVRGTSERFHCEHCDRDVHLLSNMTKAEAAAVLARRDREKLCVALVHGADGQLRFSDTPRLVSAARLGAPHRALRASAMALSLGACTPHESDRVEAVDLDVLVAKSLPSPWITRPEPEFVAAGGISDVNLPELELPDGDEQARPRASSKSRHIDAAKLLSTAVYTPEVDKRKVRTTEAARKKQDSEVRISFCVDRHGKVFNAKRVRGDKELTKLVIESVEHWRFRRRVDAKTVCTEFGVSFRFV